MICEFMKIGEFKTDHKYPFDHLPVFAGFSTPQDLLIESICSLKIGCRIVL